jgi:hypothetical protein
VAIHELLHCAHSLLGVKDPEERNAEDFAYGKSIPFLLSRGKTREWLVEKYMMPYYGGLFMHVLRQKALKANAKKRTCSGPFPSTSPAAFERPKLTKQQWEEIQAEGKEMARLECGKMIDAAMGVPVALPEPDEDDRFDSI